MPRISKKVRTLAADLLAACASETASKNSLVWIAEVAEPFLANEGLDLYERDQVMLVAAVTYRDCQDMSPYPQCIVENYLEASAKLREGFTPHLED